MSLVLKGSHNNLTGPYEDLMRSLNDLIRIFKDLPGPREAIIKSCVPMYCGLLSSLTSVIALT